MKAKKSLGQNFLKSEAALRKIIEAGNLTIKDTVLEIGPGKGALTKRLLQSAGKVIAVEKDDELTIFLQEKFEEYTKNHKLLLKNEDILDFQIPETITYKVIANIPYNITGSILKKFLTATNQPEKMVLMVQLEVAKRIVATDHKESILSISVKVYGNPKIVMRVPSRYFSPAPKVDSAVIVIENISRKFFEENKIDEVKFWELIKTGFSHKRKRLSGNLKKFFPDKKSLPAKLGDKRAEDLTLSDWILLAK